MLLFENKISFFFEHEVHKTVPFGMQSFGVSAITVRQIDFVFYGRETEAWADSYKSCLEICFKLHCTLERDRTIKLVDTRMHRHEIFFEKCR